MSPRLLRPRASGVHPEAASWRTRVLANGGSVSATTMQAVDRFCRDIDATSGLRAAILRLNLFCGTGLAAALVPLYRASSLAATQLGNAADTNLNFVSGDYAETGSSGGLKGNGTTKYLQTGFAPQSFSTAGLCHMSISATSVETSGTFLTGMGTYDGTQNASYYALEVRSSAGFPGGFASSFNGVNTLQSLASQAHLLFSRTSSSLITAYETGTSVATNTVSSGGSGAASTRQFFVFSANSNGNPIRFTSSRLRMYSIGDPLTAAQALAFSSAVNTFNQALSRA